ncbi:MAG: hypothetical protein AUK29_04760 [Nitrospirae bacterium CG2_30_53_67]|nr:MAG: hypothetical protein AUK29_04760 [Nitrospirae bacterium CG2_30_53_67]
MTTEDLDLRPADIQLLSTPDDIAAFFASLGWNTDEKAGARIKQSASALGITPESIARTIKHVERLADQENGGLQVYLFELTSVTVAAVRALSRTFRDRAGKYLLVLTSDYETIDFVFLERILPPAKGAGITIKTVGIRPHPLTVNRRNPDIIALRVLRRFTYTESDADAQADKLLSAFGIAEWSERLFNNRALFSDYYLQERLTQSPEWSEPIKPLLLKFRELYTNVRERFIGQKEGVVRSQLLEPAFDLLGFKPIEGKSGGDPAAKPDYRLYPKDSATGNPLAVCLAYTWNRYLDGKDETRDTETSDENPGAHVVTLLEAGEASWAIVTNGKIWRLYSAKAHSRATNYYEIDLEEVLAMADPKEAFQYFYLFFRAPAFIPKEELYKGEKRTVAFVDKLIEESETYAKELGEKLKARVFDKIFPHFSEGFIENMGGAEYVLSLPEKEREEKLQDCYHGTLTFLYRLLFLLYSESRNLLPVTEVRGYWEMSLTRLKAEVAKHAGTILDEAPEKIKKAYHGSSTELYDRLFKLFSVIDNGDSDVNVPLYNGGLFITNPPKDDDSPEVKNSRFLRNHKIPDRYLALGLDMMARDIDDKTQALVFIDYKSLGVRHLGSIYEGLLEFKLRIAEEKMAVVKGKKTEEIVSYAEAKKDKLRILTIGRGKNAEERVLKKGTVYLENDKRERKATGSYYTPDYIVKYIVENTVGPVLAEKLDALRPKLREAQQTLKKERDKYKALGGAGDSPENQTYLRHRHLVDELFDIKVLDPAMGSGHFLVEAVDFISDKILGDREGFLRAFPWNPITAEMEKTRQTILSEMEKQGVSIDRNRLTDVNLLKRHILKRCIYGVDLNPMAVELAKVSLWLDCFTLGAPLSFLDHHLKCGNSLIGAKVEEVRGKVETGQLSLLGGTHFQGLMLATDLMRHIGELSDVTAEQVRNSRSEYKKAVDALAPFKRYMDVYTSQWFGNEPRTVGKGKKKTEYNPALEFLRSKESEEWAKAPHKAKLPAEWKGIAATTFAAEEEKHFFHWELEFPEVFYGPRPGTTQVIERIKGAGFDAVIGNPPYDVLASEELGYEISRDVEYFLASDLYKPAVRGARNLNKLFICRGLSITKENGTFSFIVPMSLLGDEQATGIRKMMLEKTGVMLIEAFPQKDDPQNRVFAEAKLSTVIFVIRSVPTGKKFTIRTHSGKLFEDSASMLAVAPADILTFDKENATIPSCTQHDWDLIGLIRQGAIQPMGNVAKLFEGELHALTHREFINANNKGPVIIRGSNVTLYALREASQGEELRLDVRAYLKDKSENSRAFAHLHKRIGIQRSAPQNNFRRIIAAMLPEGVFCFDKLKYIPPAASKIDLDLLIAVLNSIILDWYFRLISTNAMINEYQFNSLPAPTFSDEGPSVDWRSLVKSGKWADVGNMLCSVCVEPGVMHKPVQDALTEMSRQIQKIEAARVLKNRSERSRLAPESQPIQNTIDRILFRCYGLSDEEAEYISKRLQEML